MGQILSAPVTTKHSTEGEDKRLMFGASSMQGWRISMEDAHTHILEYKDTGAAFFGVFDGHGGPNVAKYSSQKLKENVFESESFQKGDFKESLRNAFFKIDSDLRKDPEFQNEASGSTAIVALLTKDNVLYVSNAGDSRAIISTHGLAVALSQDHKPSHPKETERIQNAGGHVEFGRVNGNLALSRALGDFEFKCVPDLPPEKQAVTAEPDITVHTLTDKDEFMVLACDGIWDCLTNQEVVNFVRKHVANYVPLQEICEKLMDNCLADSAGNGGIGCDNMTVEIVAFLNGKTKDEWYNAIRETVKATSPSEIKDHSINEQQTDQKKSVPSESRQYSAKELENLSDLTLQDSGKEPPTSEQEGNKK